MMKRRKCFCSNDIENSLEFYCLLLDNQERFFKGIEKTHEDSARLKLVSERLLVLL